MRNNDHETLTFMSRHFNETMTILIPHFLHFGALKILTGDYYVLRMNKITYFKQKMGCFFHFSIFQHFSHSIFSPFVQGGVQMAYGQNYISAGK